MSKLKWSRWAQSRGRSPTWWVKTADTVTTNSSFTTPTPPSPNVELLLHAALWRSHLLPLSSFHSRTIEAPTQPTIHLKLNSLQSLFLLAALCFQMWAPKMCTSIKQWKQTPHLPIVSSVKGLFPLFLPLHSLVLLSQLNTAGNMSSHLLSTFLLRLPLLPLSLFLRQGQTYYLGYMVSKGRRRRQAVTVHEPSSNISKR